MADQAYILKVEAKGSERSHLEELSKSPQLKKLACNPNCSKRVNLALPIKYYNIPRQYGATTIYALAILPKVSGDSLKEAFERPNAMQKVGSALFWLHNIDRYPKRAKQLTYRARSPYVHGDLHLDNIMLDDQEHVTFIDNETMAAALDSPRKVTLDIIQLYGFARAHVITRKYRLSKDNLAQTFLKPLLQGYMSDMDYRDRRGFLNDVDTVFRNPQKAIFKQGRFLALNPYTLQKDYLNAIKIMIIELKKIKTPSHDKRT